ncbi:hypothetical protein ACDN41_12820 [Priestia aryabhattai]|uniref:hypothetical protein n=1 Tax=Priestia aryabhattai TaxID=412384 RepID=UPI0035320104
MDEIKSAMLERISRNEEAVKNHERRIQIQEEKNEATSRMTVIVEMLVEQNKEREARQKEQDEKQNAQMDRFSNTLENMNINLTNLNSGYNDLSQRVGNIENGKWDWNKFFKQAIPSILIGLALAALTYYFGLK